MISDCMITELDSPALLQRRKIVLDGLTDLKIYVDEVSGSVEIQVDGRMVLDVVNPGTIETVVYCPGDEIARFSINLAKP